MNDTQTTREALHSLVRSIEIRIQSLEMMIEQDMINVVASANSLQRDVQAGFVRADNGGFITSHLSSYVRNATAMEQLREQQRTILHIIETTEGE